MARISWALAFALFAGLHCQLGGRTGDVLIGTLTALGYFSVVGALVRRLEPLQGRLRRGFLFSTLWLSCVAFPGALLDGALGGIVLVLGWEVMLSAYSYAIETSKAGARRGLADCLFFVLVDPTLVYAERGAPDARARRYERGLARCLLGLGAWLAHDRLVAAAGLQGPVTRDLVLQVAQPAGYGHFLREYSGRFGTAYLQQSGLASVQIGLMTLAGYTVPECYRLPFLARSPQEFWQRWNVWVGSWARRYVFIPSSFGLRRRYRWLPVPVATAIGVLVTFLAIGLLHDAPQYGAHALRPVGAWPFPKTTVLLLFCGATLILWAWGARLLRRFGLEGSRFRLPRSVTASVAIFVVLQSFFFVHASTAWLLSRDRRFSIAAPPD